MCPAPTQQSAAGLVQAIKILNMIKMYGKPIRVNKASQDRRQQEVGANLFIGNLDVDVDEKVCVGRGGGGGEDGQRVRGGAP